MLRFFRSGGIAQIVVGGVVMAIIIVFALEFRAGRGSPTAKLQTECAVEYRGSCVDAKEFYAALALVVPRGLEEKQIKQYGVRKRVLDGLAERELLLEAAKKEGLAVSDEALDDQLTQGRAHVSVPADSSGEFAHSFGLCEGSSYGNGCEPGTSIGVRQLRVSKTQDGAFDLTIYEREVRLLTNRGTKQFREMQARELLADRVRNLVRSRARVADAEAFTFFERGRSRAVIRSVRLEQSWFMKHGIDPSIAAVQSWAAKNAAQVDEAWNVDKDKYIPGCPIVREIMVEIPALALDDEKARLKDKIGEAKTRLDKGEKFESVARALSAAPSAAFGGSIGCLNQSYGMGADDLLKAVVTLKEGQVSDVVESPRGFYLLKLEGKLEAAKVASEGRLSVARRLYARFAADEALRKFAGDLIEVTKNGNKLEDTNRSLSIKYATMYEASAAKSSTKTGETSETEPVALSEADHPKFEISPPFNVSGNPLPETDPREPIATRAFELDKPDEVYAKPIETATGAVVIQLKDKTPATRAEFEKDKWPIIKGLQQAKGNDAVARYIADLKRSAGDKLKIDLRFAEDPKQKSEE